MQPSTSLLLWSTICVIVLAIIIRIVYLYFKRKNTRTLLLAFAAVSFFSCQKQKDTVPQTITASQSVISELGFDPAKVQVSAKGATPARSFESVAEARAFVQQFHMPEKSGTLKVGEYSFREPAEMIPEEDPYDPYGGPGGNYQNGGTSKTNGQFMTEIRHWNMWVGYSVSFVWDKNNQGMPTNISSFNSGTMGLTLGTGWEHMNGSAYSIGSTIYFNVLGMQSYSIVIDGVGTFFSHPVTLSGTYNTKTGAFTIKEKF